ncbi:hypothetical protein Pth03_70410 [Planotetraspora thailandica]|uniref:Uncharacterized protein n=1 Tax=Planotetraspora thailandica TaxID=487172 RepID=A0A8J4DEY2_9ACTN|nr:hypothetical protein [Planotetraspora thailandica]GII58652.1 hypothetical protein Pth03_70410 [Planotetraspora thailandica]
MKKKTAAALLALVVAAVLGGSATPASAVDSPCASQKYGCDSHWMEPNPGNGQ